MAERVILPRISDLIEDIRSTMDRLKEGEEWEAFVLDFRDAFNHMIINADEQCHLGGRALGGSFVYLVMISAMKAGSLLWGRLAALIMRITSVINKGDNCRLQRYVDDPAMTIGGTLKARSKVMIKTVLLWLIFALKLAWNKGHRGRRGEWVGAYYRPWLESKTPGVTIGIS